MNNANHKILIADDDCTIRMLFKRVITKAGFTLAGEAEDGEQAVAMHAALSPDLTLLDVSMPRMNGVETLKKIRDGKPEALVIMLTASSDPNVLDEALTAGAASFIRKDRPLNEISQAIEKALENRPGLSQN